jgi:hypothetical protein
MMIKTPIRHQTFQLSQLILKRASLTHLATTELESFLPRSNPNLELSLAKRNRRLWLR